ncbi:hypothetical protein H257_00267 [Aphanomyces astaci]|uniref:Peptidase S54 rhomboid domain-containing protein n=1 Tax=Aphanomyces astaci TaxID=112090 RepID=W4H9Q5_APHAT|nr:hypothetical protein H257_00267 [Aphanomyces astaci]ETV88755.1 hypothetical protein H257_00267 [Aphanomyces astaci]|eukprot:XP_009821155.1 hypothetical protein H257_00267 [Aphanomyces astaci]
MSIRKLANRVHGSAFRPLKHAHVPWKPPSHGLAMSKSPAPLRSREFTNIARRLDSFNSDNVIYGLIGVNALVMCMWQKADTTAKRHFMVSNFTTSPAHIKTGHVHTLLTAAFSHADAIHFFGNMTGLFFFGREVCAILGPKRFLGLYLGSAVAVSLAQVVSQPLYSSRNSLSLGASGAVNAVTAFSISMFPRNTFRVMFILPLPAYAAGTLFILRDLWGALGNIVQGSGHVTDLVGAGIGMFYFRRIYGRRSRFRRL